MNNEPRVWGIHTFIQNESSFLQGNLSIGWPEMGDLSAIPNQRDAFRDKYSATHPTAPKGNIAINAGTLYRFACEMKPGDYIIFPAKSDRKIYIGTVESDYQLRPKSTDYPHQRRVKWLKHFPRTAFSQGALYEIGAFTTLFSVKNYADEFLAALNGNHKRDLPTEDESIGVTAEEIKENTKDFILKELTRQLKGYDLEEFIADLLRAMGYRATVSPRGGDSGVDITAYKDEFPPRILIQVKSIDGDIPEATIQSLRGAMREGDYGLFITLSDYTKNAKKYLAATPIIRGINGAELAELILKYYDGLSDHYQQLLPLEMTYIPKSESPKAGEPE